MLHFSNQFSKIYVFIASETVTHFFFNLNSSTNKTEAETKPRMDYLAELIREKSTIVAFPNHFRHADRLIDIEIARVRAQLFQCNYEDDTPKLPELDSHDDIITLQEKIYVPIKEYPEFNFVGRILGPRGMTAKQLEHETGCKIMIRGRGSLRDDKKEEANRGKPNWEHLEDALHILIQCEDTDKRARTKIDKAMDRIKKMLVPTNSGIDELKRKQLMELSIINGTYRSAIGGPKNPPSIPRLTPLSMLSPIRMSAGSPPPFFPPGGAQQSLSSPMFFGSTSPLPSPVKDSFDKYHHNQLQQHPRRSVPLQHNGKGAEPSFDFSQLLKHLE